MGRSKTAEKKLKEGIDGMIKEGIEKEIDKLESDKEETDDNFIGPPYPETEEDPELERILASFPSSEGYYGKLYYKTSNGKLEYKHFVENLEKMEDPELDIANMVRERGWKSGEYVLRIMQKKRGAVIAKTSLNLNIASENDRPTEKASSALENLTGMKEIITTVKEITGDKVPTSQALTDVFKLGIESMKNAMPKQEGEGGILKTVEVMKSLGLIKSTDNQDTVMKTITVMKELMGPQKPQEDVFAVILKLREANILKFSGEQNSQDNVEDSVEKLKSLIELATMIGGGSGLTPEKQSVWFKLIEIVGPQVPRIIEQLSTTVNNVVELSKIKLSHRLGAPVVPGYSTGAFPPKIMPHKPVPGPKPELEPEHTELSPVHLYGGSDIGIEIPPGVSTKSIPVGDKPVEDKQTEVSVTENRHPIVISIVEAVSSDNPEFYPQLKSIIVTVIGQHALDALVEGHLTIDEFTQQISRMMGDVFFTEQATKNYFQKFLDWYIDALEQSKVMAQCKICNATYDFQSMEEWNKDSKICGENECNGSLELVTQERTGNV